MLFGLTKELSRLCFLVSVWYLNPNGFQNGFPKRILGKECISFAKVLKMFSTGFLFVETKRP